MLLTKTTKTAQKLVQNTWSASPSHENLTRAKEEHTYAAVEPKISCRLARVKPATAIANMSVKADINTRRARKSEMM